jgi:hypothetical protein
MGLGPKREEKTNHQQLLATMVQQQDLLGVLTAEVAHFQKVTASYWNGLFACHQVHDLPPTNNRLQQFFGTARHVERRVTGPDAKGCHQHSSCAARCA